MQPEIPYRVIGKLGSCDVGTVWSAIDEARGLPVTVAVLDARAAGDQRWRDAFAGHAGAINGAAPAWVGADFAAPAPWVAFDGTEDPGAERVFISLGRPYTPAAPQNDAPTQLMSPVSGVPNQPVSGMPVSGTPVSGMPVSGMPVSGTPVSGMPVSGSPVSGMPVSGTPVSGTPVSGAPSDMGLGGNAYGLESSPRRPYFGEGAEDPYGASVGGSDRRGNRLWIGVAATVAVLVLAGAVFFGVTLLGDDGDPQAGPTGAPGATTPASPAPPPIRPGLEPPRPGDWPNWPKYGEGDAVRPFKLQGLGFDMTLPQNWECTSNPNAVQYTCGLTKDGVQEAGGDIMIRPCAAPCDEDRRTQLRAVEDAFGAQWRFAGENTTIAENPKLDGVTGYGLVVIGYFRSTELGPIDRQLVLRLTGGNGWADEFRKIANGVHDVAGI